MSIALLLSTAHASDEPASPRTSFFHANALYKDGQYEAAAREYEQVLASGLASGNLYFNLGNAYFKLGEKGTAILNYERAEHLVPGDPDVEANLRYARTLTKAEACTPSLWQRLLFPLAQRLSTAQLLWLATILYGALMLGLIGYRLSPVRPRALAYAGMVLTGFVVIAATSLASRVAGEHWQRRGVVIRAGETATRFEPAEDGTVHYVLKEGSPVQILATRQGWLQVARCDGRRGWLPAVAVGDL